MQRATREAVLARRRTWELVPIPEWDMEFVVATLGWAERLEFERWSKTLSEDSDDWVAGLLAFALVDDQGQRLFTNEDIKALMDQDAPVVTRLSRIARRLNWIGDAEVDAIKGES